MINEEVSDKAVRIAVSTVKLSGRALYQGLKSYVNHHKNKVMQKQTKQDDPVRGKQTVKQLIGQGQGVSSMEVGDEGIRDFLRIAKKYGVDFAIVKDKAEEPPKYVVFFKAKDVDAITMILKEYAARQMKKQERRQKPSILEKLRKFKETISKQPHRDKERRKDRER